MWVEPGEVDTELALCSALRDKAGPHAILDEPSLRLLWFQRLRDQEAAPFAEWQAALQQHLHPVAVRTAVNTVLSRAPLHALQLAMLGVDDEAQSEDDASITISAVQV